MSLDGLLRRKKRLEQELSDAEFELEEARQEAEAFESTCEELEVELFELEKEINSFGTSHTEKLNAYLDSKDPAQLQLKHA